MADRAGSTGSTRSPTLAELIDRAREATAWGMRVMLPAAVSSYDASKGMVAVKPLLKRAYIDEEGNRQVAEFPVIPGVPVAFAGAGGFRETFPVSDGTLVIDGATLPATTGYVIFCDRSLDVWLSGDGQLVDPAVDTHHALADAVFEPGLRTFGSPWQSIPTDHATIGADAGKQIHMRSSTICIGDEAGSQLAAMGGKVNDNFSTLYNVFNTLFGPTSPPLLTAAPGAPDVVYTALKAAFAALVSHWPPDDVQAEQAKVR